MYLDRIKRKPLLVWGNLLSAVMILPLLLVEGAGDVWIIYAVAFAYGVSNIVIPAGLNGLLQEMIPGDLLVEANASVQTVKQGFRVVGPAIGAGLFAQFGGGVVAIDDSVSFVVAAMIIASIPVRENLPARGDQHWWLEMTGGITHLVREPVLRHTLVAFGLSLVVLNFSSASMFAVVEVFGQQPTFVGILLAAQGAGAILGGLTAARWVHRLGGQDRRSRHGSWQTLPSTRAQLCPSCQPRRSSNPVKITH